MKLLFVCVSWSCAGVSWFVAGGSCCSAGDFYCLKCILVEFSTIVVLNITENGVIDVLK